MKNLKSKFLSKAFLSLFFICAFTQNGLASNSRNLTVFAEQNMVLALTKIARLYSQKNNVVVSINFNSSLELLNDVDSGEPADVFISANSAMIDSLRQKGLIDVYNVSYIARDKLVLVTSKNNTNIDGRLLKKDISLSEAIKILDENRATLIIDQEGSSSEKYSSELIQSLNLTGDKLSLVKKLKEDKASILNSLKESPDHFVMVVSSQIKNRQDLAILSSAKEDRIFYQALVIAGDNMESAREFLKFLKSNTARAELRHNGFITD